MTLNKLLFKARSHLCDAFIKIALSVRLSVHR